MAQAACEKLLRCLSLLIAEAQGLVEIVGVSEPELPGELVAEGIGLAEKSAEDLADLAGRIIGRERPPVLG